MDMCIEDVIKIFRYVLPDNFPKEVNQAIKRNDKERLKELEPEADSIIRAYMEKIQNRNMNPGEQVVWKHDAIKGVLKKDLIQAWTITNLRAMIYQPRREEKIYQDLATILTIAKQEYELHEEAFLSVGLAVSDTVVMNQYRDSSSSRTGTFIGTGGRAFSGVTTSSGSSTSRTKGDLVFFFLGKEWLQFSGITDPQGVRRMVEALKKQGLPDIQTPTEANQSQERCKNCGVPLSLGDKYCSACGIELGKELD